MKKLMVIGAGIGQVNIIEKAKARGIWVIVVSTKGEYPGLAIADDVLYMDIYNRDAIVEYARKEKIDAITSDQNDLMMPTVAYVAEKLGLPGNTFDQAIAYSNKNIFRDNCEKLEIPIPRYTAIEDLFISDALKDIPLPWIIKPEDSQSSIGISKVDSEDELPDALQLALEKSKNRRAIVEEFFLGHEVVCEGFIYKGEYHLLAFADRRYFNLPNLFIPSQTVFPSTVKQSILDRIVEYEKLMAAHINPNFGIVHSEYLINLESEEIRVVESALRGGGVYISSHLIPLATGIDINNLLLDCALGEENDIELIINNRKERAAAYSSFYLPEGIITRVEGLEELKNMYFVKKIGTDGLKVGSSVSKMLHKGMRKGPILVDAESRTELERHFNYLQNTLKINVENPDGIIEGIKWE